MTLDRKFEDNPEAQHLYDEYKKHAEFEVREHKQALETLRKLAKQSEKLNKIIQQLLKIREKRYAPYSKNLTLTGYLD